MNGPRTLLLISVTLIFGCTLLSLSKSDFQVFQFEALPRLGTTAAGQAVPFGGFSGLHYLRTDPVEQSIHWMSITDRGPNAEAIENPESPQRPLRPFIQPTYTPEIVHFTSSLKSQSNQITRRIPITDPRGRPISGLPNTDRDEIPVDGHLKPLKQDLMGMDFEGITMGPDGTLWAVEEYRPSLVQMTSEGRILKRHVPKGSFSPQQLKEIEAQWGPGTVIESLPPELIQRRPNRGFEGVTLHRGRIVAALQSPHNHQKTQVLWIAFDPITQVTTHLLRYPLSNEKVDKIGDLSSDGESIFVIEQNSETGDLGVHQIQKVLGLKNWEDLPKEVFLEKKLVVDFNSQTRDFEKFDHSKWEGLAITSEGALAVLHDNDFGLNGHLDPKTKVVPMQSKVGVALALFPRLTGISENEMKVP